MTKDMPKEIRARCEAATEGPWTPERGDLGLDGDARFPTSSLVTVYAYDDCDIHPLADCSCNHTCREEEVAVSNAAFIAHARTDIPALLDALETALAQLNVAREGLMRIGGCPDRQSAWDVSDETLRRMDEVEGG